MKSGFDEQAREQLFIAANPRQCLIRRLSANAYANNSSDRSYEYQYALAFQAAATPSSREHPFPAPLSQSNPDERPMMPYDNSNSGMMYRNIDKQSDSHPDFTGFIDIDGEEFWLSAWVKESKDGGKLGAKGIEKYFSLKFKPKEAKREERKPEPTKKPYDGKGGFDDMPDDIPF